MNKVILNDVIEIISGGTPKTNIKEYWEGGTIGWLSVNDFNNDLRKVYLSEKSITKAGLKNSSTKILEVGDIIISARGTVGALAQIGHPMAFNQSCFGIRGKENLMDNTYLYYVLKNYIPNMLKKVQGSVFNTINLDSFKIMELEIERDIAIQRKIAAVLSALDDKIELNRKINAELEQMARTLYDYWFVQFDFPDVNGKPYKSSGGQMAYNDQLKREIPEGWQALKLQDVLEFEKGTEPGADAYSDVNNDEYDFPFYRVGNIDGETDTYIDSSKFNTKTAKPSDVIVTFDGSVGKMGLGISGAISGGLRHIYDKSGKISDAAVYAIFGNEYITKTIERYATGSVILHASSSIPYLAIPYDEQAFAVFQEIVEPMFAKIIANRQQSQNLAHLRDWLLPMLMNGQVKVI